MADFVATLAALRSALEAGFSALPLYWPNDPREPTLEDCPNGFVFSEGRLLDERASTLGPAGARTHRDTGEFLITVFVPAGTLAGAAEGHAEAIRALFKTRSVAGVVTTRRTIGQGQHVNGPLGRFWAVPVVIEYFTDRTE